MNLNAWVPTNQKLSKVSLVSIMVLSSENGLSARSSVGREGDCVACFSHGHLSELKRSVVSVIYEDGMHLYRYAIN